MCCTARPTCQVQHQAGQAQCQRGQCTWQLLEQPSPSARLPSSHCSAASSTPLPHSLISCTTCVQRGSKGEHCTSVAQAFIKSN